MQAHFLAHGGRYRWDPRVHVVSDFTIALAYYSIPASLIYIVRPARRPGLPLDLLAFRAVYLACRTTHLLGVVVVWQPWYRLDGVVKAITAIASGNRNRSRDLQESGRVLRRQNLGGLGAGPRL